MAPLERGMKDGTVWRNHCADSTLMGATPSPIAPGRPEKKTRKQQVRIFQSLNLRQSE